MMAVYKCTVCDTIFDEEKEGRAWHELDDDWQCHVCDSGKKLWKSADADLPEKKASPAVSPKDVSGIDELKKEYDEFEIHMADIHSIAESGTSITEPMRTRLQAPSWDDILIKGAQLARIPLAHRAEVKTETVIGPGARRPLVISTPIYVSHMSFGALSREAKLALSNGSAAAETAMCSGEGGILSESLQSAYKYIFEYVPNRYSVTDEYLNRVDAVEIKFGQSTKPGMGGHLPGGKVTAEIAAIRGFPEGEDIISPSFYEDIRSREDLKRKIDWLREKTGGKPIGVKFAAGNVEGDLEFALAGKPDFITIDGRPGATGSSPKFVKAGTSVPTIYALYRARKYLEKNNIENISLVITGGLRISADFAKALALGADAVAIASASLMAIGCQQYKVCHTGKCPMGITTQDPELRARLDISASAGQLANFLRVSTEEIREFCRLTGRDDVHKLDVKDLCTINSEISSHTDIEHA
jgi:glutamate synthase domain-containing protein 2/rubredoxin